MAKRFRFEYVYDSLVLSDNGQPLIKVKGNEEEKQLLLEVLNEMHEEKEHLQYELNKLSILYKAKQKTEDTLIKMGKELEEENRRLKEDQ